MFLKLIEMKHKLGAYYAVLSLTIFSFPLVNLRTNTSMTTSSFMMLKKSDVTLQLFQQLCTLPIYQDTTLTVVPTWSRRSRVSWEAETLKQLSRQSDDGERLYRLRRGGRIKFGPVYSSEQKQSTIQAHIAFPLIMYVRHCHIIVWISSEFIHQKFDYWVAQLGHLFLLK